MNSTLYNLSLLCWYITWPVWIISCIVGVIIGVIAFGLSLLGFQTGFLDNTAQFFCEWHSDWKKKLDF